MHLRVLFLLSCGLINSESMACDNTESGDVQSDRILTPLLGACVSIELSVLVEVSQRSVMLSNEVSVIPLAGAHSQSLIDPGLRG